MANKKNTYCLVLGGGGGRGAYEIGVWRALRKLGIGFHAVAGTSVGALNAAFVAQNDYEGAMELFSFATIRDIADVPEKFLKDGRINRDLNNLRRLSSYVLSRRGLDTSPMKKLINHYLREETIRKSGIDFGLVTFDLSQFRPRHLFLEDIPDGQLADYLLASASYPLFRSPVIDQSKLTDGGVADNMPYNMMKERGYRRIITVNLSGVGRTRRPQTENTQTVYLKNSQPLEGALEIFPENSRRAMDLGYLDTLQSFEEIDGIRYFIQKDLPLFRSLEEHFFNERNLPLMRSAAKGLIKTEKGAPSKPEHLVRKLLPRDLAKYRFPVIPAIECTAICLGIPREPLYSLPELIRLIREEEQKLGSIEPFTEQENFPGLVRRLRGELDSLKTAGLLQLPPARYVTALRTVTGMSDGNFAVRMLHPLFPELPVANLMLRIIQSSTGFFY
ncbi:patatin-like phospholipase family protein [Marispirochaeta aestuarii]|uniref:patatin-like phospholipase family protein n=1 Tax=Marispirochaeta aestuarii TaxID=1963862 RepID=UPI0029C68831|nr:patatin-like phospholipase family protein [Marispirochaeta aestuarii]